MKIEKQKRAQCLKGESLKGHLPIYGSGMKKGGEKYGIHFESERDELSALRPIGEKGIKPIGWS
jgi:hypothetical protein